MNPGTTSPPHPLEVLDVLWRQHPATGERGAVSAADAMARLRAGGQERAARLIQSLPAVDDVLDQHEVDRVFLAVHCELARLGQYLEVPQRMATDVRPLVAAIREREGDGPVFVIDVGCGIGLALRWMAATAALGPDVEYVGIDINALLVEAATRLATAESIPASFTVGDAYDIAQSLPHPERTVVVSQGLLHHVDPGRLTEFFARHHEARVGAFAHFDVQPGLWSTLGGWVLHHVRMREPISRHDGNLSLRRALGSDVLLAHAEAALGEAYALECSSASPWLPAPHRALRPIVGLRR